METTPTYFRDLKLSPKLLTVIEKAGFEHPTPIQEQGIPLALMPSDLIGCAQTGTGKTLAFCLPLLEKLQGKKGTHALILCPTREIALQTQKVLEQFGPAMGLSSTVLIGGRRILTQANALKKNPSIIVATPGRLMDHMERRNVNLKNIHAVVLDEADHMLDLGFLPQVRRILKALPKERQTLMFSATFPREIEQLAQQFLKDPNRVDIAPPGTAAEGIDHHLYLMDPQYKREAILKLLQGTDKTTLVFTRTKLDAEWLFRLLKKEGHDVHALHSDRTQGQRVRTLEQFKRAEFPILVATDIMARGIDVSGIAHVINYDIPQNPEDYIHRAGRTARGQATGHASTLATTLEFNFIQAIEKQLGEPIPRRQLPGIPEITETIPKKRRKRVRLR
ncbi:MAG: DEAD/DEAH box helicase [bacterium]|nr:DEAD/DEAH box helicase [bacterium]